MWLKVFLNQAFLSHVPVFKKIKSVSYLQNALKSWLHYFLFLLVLSLQRPKKTPGAFLTSFSWCQENNQSDLPHFLTNLRRYPASPTHTYNQKDHMFLMYTHSSYFSQHNFFPYHSCTLGRHYVKYELLQL